MVMLASYDIQSALYRCFDFTVKIGFSPRMQSAVSSVVWLQFELVCNDPRNTVLMMPPSLPHYSLGGEGQEREDKVGKITMWMASLDTRRME